MKINIGGVPEHFNYPWHLAIESKSLSNIGIDAVWHDMPGGTGEMCRKLRTGEIDLAVVLTEGIVADIAAGNPSMIVQKYIKSPLIWGIHTGNNSAVSNETSYENLRFAISRKGSGSHLMACVEAKNRGIQLKDEQFVEVANFDNAIDALNNGKADLFLWEKFTTKPTVDAGKIRRIGETVTPWPCFVIAARQEILLKNPDTVWNLLWVIRKMSRHFMIDENAEQIVSAKYGLSRDDTHSWFNKTEWEQDVYISKKMLNNVVNTLVETRIIDKKIAAEDLCWGRCVVY
ncbi:MAG: ABC transporter substrate-binding protein [Flavobacteriales bacterium]|nr:ABC transporter substrate-binding protein [Flavobacteriales bacterium]